MNSRDAFWVFTAVVLGAAAGTFVGGSLAPDERVLPVAIVLLQSVATLLWIWRSHVVEQRQVAMLRDRRYTVAAENLRAAIETIESTQSAASNSLIATGIILSAVVLVHNAVQFANPKSNAASLLAVAPKAFTATGFGLVCGLLLMVRAHFGALQQLAAIRPATRDDRPMGPSSDAGTLAAVAAELRAVAGNFQAEHIERQQSAGQLKNVIEEVATLVAEARKQVPKSALGRLAAATEQFSKDVQEVCQAVADLKTVLEEQAESVRETSREALHTALTQQASASLEAFREKMLSGFGQRMDQLAGRVERRVDEIVDAAQQTSEKWKPDLEETLTRLGRTIEQKSEEVFKDLRDRTDGYLSEQVEKVLNDVTVADRNLEGLVEHLRGMNQNLSLLLNGLAETEATLKTFVPNGSQPEGSARVTSFLQQVGQLAETVDRVALRFLHEFESLEGMRQKVQALRSEINEALTDSSN